MGARAPRLVFASRAPRARSNRRAPDLDQARPARSWALATDVRFEVFAVVFAFGTILHELQVIRELMDTGPLLAYLDRWRPVPTPPWPSWLAAALHLGNIAISVFVIAGRWRRETVCLLALTILASLLAIPHRLPSHNSVMAAGMGIVLVMAAGEWIDRFRHRHGSGRPRTDWCGATLSGLAWICALTYFFAFLYKLNRGWFSSASPAPDFLIPSVAPLLAPLGLHGWRPIAAAVAIYATVLIELTLPPLLFHPRTRRFACLLGMLFHLPMVWGAVGDFPVILLAFYAAFLSRDDLHDLLRRLSRPTAVRLVSAAALGGHGISLVQQTHQARMIARLRDRAALLAWESWLIWVAALGLAYVTVTLIPWCAAAAGPQAARPELDPGGARLPPAVRPRLRPATLLVVFVAALFAANNVAPFVGVPGYGHLDMYSKASSDLRNHLFHSRIKLTGAFDYVRIVRLEPHAAAAPANRGFQALVRESQRQGYAFNLNFLRYHLGRLCDSAPGAAVRLTLRTATGEERAYPDACAEGALRWYVPVPLVANCRPRCASLKRWIAEGTVPEDGGHPPPGHRPPPRPAAGEREGEQGREQDEQNGDGA